jgi:hypothetical protein
MIRIIFPTHSLSHSHSALPTLRCTLSHSHSHPLSLRCTLRYTHSHPHTLTYTHSHPPTHSHTTPPFHVVVPPSLSLSPSSSSSSVSEGVKHSKFKAILSRIINISRSHTSSNYKMNNQRETKTSNSIYTQTPLTYTQIDKRASSLAVNTPPHTTTTTNTFNTVLDNRTRPPCNVTAGATTSFTVESDTRKPDSDARRQPLRLFSRVSEKRGEPVDLYHEIHGTGIHKILFITVRLNYASINYNL